ncbi:MAG: hypothetical protein ACK4HV_05010 [Parachlamydiaceae bacterium]
MRGDILNSTLLCYFKKSSAFYNEEETQFQIAGVMLGITVLALNRLKRVNEKSLVVPITLFALTAMHIQFSRSYAAQLDKDMHEAIRFYKNRSELFDELAARMQISYQSIRIIGYVFLYLLSVSYSLSTEGPRSPFALILFGSVFYLFLRLNSDSIQLNKRLLEKLHECK